jgi:hypothetical protein
MDHAGGIMPPFARRMIVFPCAGVTGQSASRRMRPASAPSSPSRCFPTGQECRERLSSHSVAKHPGQIAVIKIEDVCGKRAADQRQEKE